MTSTHVAGGLTLCCVAVFHAVILLGSGPARAQQAPPAAHQGSAAVGKHDLQLMFFYKDPRPDRLVGLLEELQGRSDLQWDGFVVPAGVLAVVFRKHPTSIDKLLPRTMTARTAEVVTAALTLAGSRASLQRLRPRLAAAGSDPTLKAEFAELPDHPEKVVIRTGTHLDLVWGAAFATGDERFPTMIASFVAQTANRSELVAIDVALVAVALSGGPRDILGTLRSKYGDQGAREIVIAATGLWALGSNARQHPFVASAVEKYVQAHSGTPANKALSVIVLRRQPQRQN